MIKIIFQSKVKGNIFLQDKEDLVNYKFKKKKKMFQILMLI